MGAETPYWGRYMWPAMPIFELVRAIPVKIHVWKFGSDWLNLSRVIVSTNIQRKRINPRLGRVTFDLWYPFSNSVDIFQSKVMCENLVWTGWNRRNVNFHGWGWSPLLEGVACELRCPFSNTAELFQSKVMCENLVWIGWAFQELSR